MKAVQNKKIEKRNDTLSSKRGFSLIETIISTFLITVGLIASIELISSGLRESMDSRDQLIANSLAQEGIELVRNVRDNNWLLGAPETFFGFPSTAGEVCNIDKDNSLDCTGSSEKLFLNSDGFYVHDSSGTATTKFQRKLIIDGDTENKTVVSIVTWGASMPDDKTTCNTSSKCTYVETTFSKWGEGTIQ